MGTSLNNAVSNIFCRRIRRYFTLLAISILSIYSVTGQAPAWVNPYPTASDVTAVNVKLNFRLNKAATIYWLVYTYDATVGASLIKSWHTNPITSSFRGGGTATYTSGDVGSIISSIHENLLPNQNHWILIVAEGAPGQFSTVEKLSILTPSCPSIYVATAFNNADRCVNGDGATKAYDLTTYNGFSSQYSNVLKGATWTISWGDGSPDYTYTSAYDNDGPGNVAMPGMEYLSIPHTYTEHDSCYMRAVLSITNPGVCAAIGFQTERKDVLLAGRDWDPDGNGSQLLVDVATGSPDTIKVCEGQEAFITLRDDGTWDCDEVFKVYPPGEMNSSDRHVQFVYGMHPVTKAVENTITGPVAITGTYPGNATTAAGHASGIIHIPTAAMNPVTNPHTESDVIRIPGTAIYKEKIHVYFKNWNKCNPYTGPANEWDGSAVWDSIVIYIVRTPPPPTPNNQTICVGDPVPALTVSAPQATAFYWYSDPGLTTIATGSNNTNTYNTGISSAIPSTTTFYVTQVQGAINGCESQATPVTLTINPIPDKPTISRNNPDFCYDGISSVVLTADPLSPPDVSRYQWYKGGSEIAGATGQTITLTTVAQSGSYTVRTYGIDPTDCPSPISDPIIVLIDQPAIASVGASQSFCGTTSTSATLSGNAPGGGATGYWSYPVIWREDFNDLPDGTTVDNGATAWTRTKPANMDWGEVRGHRFEARDIDGECVWQSEIVDISGFTNVGAAVRLIAGGSNDLASDYIRAYYRLNGASEIALDNGLQAGASGTDLASVNNLNGTTLQIVIRIRNDQDNEYYYFDDVIIAESGAPAITDPSNPTSTVTNLPQGPTVFTWTVTSQYGICPPASANLTITRDAQPTAANAGPAQATCETTTATMAANIVDNGGTGTWTLQSGTGLITDINSPTTTVMGLGYGPNVFRWRITSALGICSATQSNVTITRYNNPDDKTIVPAASPICYNTSTNINVPLSQSGIRYDLYKTAGPTLVGSVNGNGGTVSVNTGNLTSNTSFYMVAVNTTTTCTRTLNTVTVVVNPQFTLAQLHDSKNICPGLSTNFHVTLTGGTSPYTINYTRNGTALSTGPGYISGTDISTGVLATGNYVYELASVTDANNCPVEDLGTPITIVVGSEPTGAIFTGSGPDCEGESSWIKINITGGAPPYDLIINGYGAYDDYISGTNILLPVLGIGNHTYSITSLIDDCGKALGTLPGPLTITIYENPVADAGADQNVCGTRTTTLSATPSVGAGTWTLTGSNPGTITGWGATSATNPSGTPTVSVYGTYNFKWTELNGICSDEDIVVINFYENPTNASAGTAPVPSCDALTVTLAGTEHTYLPAPNVNSGTQTWSVVSKPDASSTVNFTNINSPISAVTVNHYGTYTLRWTETNGTCSVSSEITFTFYEKPDGGGAGTAPVPVCDALTVTLAGSEHSYLASPNVNIGTQTWSIVSKPHASSTVNFANITSPTTAITVNHYGSYTLRWTEINGNCTVSSDITITFYENPDGASAGTAPAPVCDALTVTLAGSEHTYLTSPNVNSGTKTWIVVSKPHVTSTVNFSNINSATSSITVNHYGPYTLRWAETNGSCSNSSEITITFYEKPDGCNAGTAPIPVCDALTATLAGTEHTYLSSPHINSGTQTWNVVSKPDPTSTVSFSNISNPSTSVTVNHYGTYTLRWTETNGNCSFSPADITFTFYEKPVANAGSDDVINVNLTYNLAAVPYVYEPAPNVNSGTYQWTLQSSTTGGSVTDWGTGFDTPTPTITVDKYGDYVLRWTETNGNCTDYDVITLKFVEGANAGPDQDLCNVLSTTLAANSPSTGQGTWSKISGPGNIIFNDGVNNPLTTITADQYGSYVLQWTLSVGTPPFNEDQVTIDFNEMPTANAGLNYNICYTNEITLSGIIGGGATSASWSISPSSLNGAGIVTNIPFTGNPLQATYTLDPSDEGKTIIFRLTTDDPDGSCPAVWDDVEVHINPLPVTSPITGPSVLCEDATNKVYQVVNTPGSTYAWTVPASLDNTMEPGLDNLYFIIVDAVPGMAMPGDKITVTETISATGCVGTPVELPVTVVSIQPGVVVNGPTSVCLGDTAIYSVPDNSGSTYSWGVPPGAYIITNPNSHSVEVTFKMAVTGDVSVIENSNGVCNTIHTPVIVTVNPLPAIFNLTAPVAYCAVESGVTITLSGSQVGVNYQLYNSLGADGALLPGSGSALTWPDKTTETYYVIATNATTGCKQLMNGTVVPTINIVDGGSIGIDQAVCENSTPAAFTSTVAGTAGGVLTYQWLRSTDNSTWTDIPGATSAVYASGPLSANTYFRRMTFSTLGSSVCEDPSNSVLVTVIIFNPGSIGSDISICEGTAPADPFTSVPPSGTGTFTFRWLSSTDGVNYTPAGSTAETFTPGVLYVDTWFKREVTATYMTRACIEETNYVKVTVINFSPGSIGSDQTICSGTSPAPFTSVAATGDGSFTYSWESSPDGNAPWTILGVNTATYSSPALTFDRYFRRAVTATHGGTSCTLYTNTVHVTVNDFDPGTIGTAKTICEGDNSGLLNSVLPASGDPLATFAYQWLISTDGTNFSAISGATNESYTSGPLLVDTHFRRQVTATLNGRACIEVTPSILIQVNNLTSGSIDGTQTVCEGEIPSAFTEAAAAVTDGIIMYQWQESANGTDGWTDVASGGNAATYAPPAALAEDMWFKRIVTSTLDGVLCTKESNVIRVTVNNFDPGSIADNQSICENSPAAPLTSVSPSGDGTFTYRWRRSTDGVNFSLIGSATSETYNPGIIAEDTWYRRIVRSTVNGKTCVDSTNFVKVTVLNFDPGSITGEQIICDGDTPAALGSNPPSGDGPFTYQWKQSTDGITWTNVPSGGSGLTYAPPALTQDTWYKRVVTSSDGVASCSLETDPLKITVINFNPGSIASDQTICENTAPATFTSVAASGDGIKTYQWQISTDGTNFANIDFATNATYTSPALTQDTWFQRLSIATDGTKSCTLPTNSVFVKVIRFDPGVIGTNQTICEGEIPALLTETTPASGNGTITYLWQSSLDDSDWNNITGATSSTYAPGALTQDTYFRRQVSATLDGRTCTEWTPSVIVRVNNLTPGSISGTQTICEGDTPAQLTETSAGTSDFGHTYQWQQSINGTDWINVPSDGNNPTYIPPALSQDTWYKRLITSTVDLHTCLEESNIIKVTVNNFNPGSVEENQTICENTPAALLTSITPTGDGTFAYQWFRSPNPTDFTPIAGALNETYNPGILSQDTWYYREVKSTLNGKECFENTNNVIITVNNLTPGSISDDQIICEGGNPDPFTSGGTLSYDGTVSYMWQSSTDGINFTDIGATDETYDSPALTEDTWYKRGVTSIIGLNACTEYTDAVKVTVINFAPGSIGSSQTICEGATPAPFTSVAASGDGDKSYQWEISSDSIDWDIIPLATNPTYASPALTQDTWFRRLSSATVGSVKCTEITDTIKVTVINFDPGTISGAQTICENGTPSAFTSTSDALGDGLKTYQWQASLDGTNFTNITGATENVYAHGSMTTDTWFRRQATATLKGFQCTEWTDPILVAVNNMTPGSISGTQTICEDVTPAAFTSVPATGDGDITYQWMQSPDNGANWGPVPSGGDVEIYVAPQLIADMWYKRLATSTAGIVPCVEESNVIMVTVNNFNPGNIAAEQTICENTAPAPFTSITPTGDGVFTYRWFKSPDRLTFNVIPTAISETYSPGILAQDTWYFREVTSTVGTNKCIDRTDTIKITVNNFDHGDIAGTKTICEDTAPVAFTETTPAASYDGAAISYQWQDSPDGIFFTDIPSADGVTYTAPALSADTWYRRAVKATLETNECTEYSSIIKVTVINFAPGSIGSNQTICEGSAPAAFTSVAASGDGTKSYQWQFSHDSISYSNVLTGGLNATYSAGVLTQDTWFRRLSTATVVSDQCTEITDTIRITVINFDPGTISADQTICEGDTPAEVTSPAAGGDGIVAYQWQSSTDGSSFSGISGATSQNYAPGALTVDTWFKRQVTATVNGMSCMKFTPAVKITVNNVLPGSIGGAQTICVNGTPLALTSVTAATGDGTITYQWQESNDNGGTWGNVPSDGDGPTYAPPALSADMLYKRIAFSNAGGKICPAESNTVKITVVNFDPGSIGDAQTICEGTAPNALTSVSPSGDGSFTFKWYRSPDNSTWSLINGAESETYSPGILTQDTWYYREVTASIGVTTCSANTNSVLITVNNFLPGSLDTDQTICEGGNPGVITGNLPGGDGLSYTYKWYESLDGTVFTEISGAIDPTFDPPALTVDTWYKRAVTSHLNGNACTEETNSIRIWVINFAPGTIGEDQTICEGSAPAPFTGTAPSGDGTFTYSWEYSTNSGTSWSPVPGGVTTATYSAPALTADTWYRRVVTSSLNGFTCSETTPVVIVTVNNFDPGNITADQWICEGETPAPFGSGHPSGDGTFTYQWQSSLNGTNWSNITGETDETYSSGPLVADTWFRRLVTSTLNGNTCTEPTTDIKVTVNNLTAGAIGSDQIICDGTVPATLTSVSPTYDGIVAYEWHSSTDGTSFALVGGANSETYDPPALTADTWYKRMVTSTLNGVSCKEESNVVRITVNNFDPGSISTDQTICEGSAPAPILSVTPTGDGIFSYKWFRSTNGTDFNDEILGALSETYNPGNLIADTWYRREVTSTLGTNTCTELNDPVKITVNNLDPGSVAGEQVICEGDVPSPVGGTAATGDGDITYQWRMSNDGVNYTDITTDGQDQNYVPGALTQDTWFLRLATSDYFGQKCTEISGSFRVIVNNVNPGTIISDQTICNGSDPVPFISIVHGTGDGNVTYEWESSTDGTNFDPISLSNAPNYDSPVLTEDTWVRRITRSDIDGNICEKISNIVKVTVNEVHGGAIASDQSICFGKTPVPFTSEDDGSGTGSVTYQWQRSGDGVIWNTISGETDKIYAPGVLYSDTWFRRVLISIQNGVFCQAESNPVKITVNSLPVAVLTGGETICPGDPATLTINITDGTPPYVVDIENHGVVTIATSTTDIPVYPLAGIVTYKLLKVTDFYGCEAVNMFGTATVTVRELPDIDTGPSDQIACEYGVVKFEVVATGTDLVYQWYVKKDESGFFPITDAGIYYGAQTPTLNLYGVTRDMNGYMFHVTVTTCGSTKQSADVKLTVNTVPEIVQQPKDTTICSTDDAAFLILATGTNLTYRWQFKPPSGIFTDVVDDGVNFTGAADSILYLTNVPLSFNNYLFRVIVDGTCGSELYSNFVALRVNGPPIPVLHPVDRAVCDGSGPVFFVGNGAGIIDSIRWQVSTNGGTVWDDIYDGAIYSGTTSQQLSLINVPLAYNNNRYRLALKAFCATAYTDSAVLTVNQLPVVTFAEDPIPACGNDPVVITPIITGGSGTWSSHNWSGDIGPLNNYFIETPTFRTLIAETYTLNYRVVDDNMCAGEGTVKVVVDAPDATFSHVVSMGCTPATVGFTKDMTGMASWTWDFGDGTPVNTTDANPVHVFTNTTSTAIVYRTVSLTVQSNAGCSDTKTSMVTIYPAIIANLTADDDTVCHGSELTFTADPGANIYKWDYGDGTPVVPGINTSRHMFLNGSGDPITRTVEVVTTSLYGCLDSTTIDIVVMPMPQVQFTATPSSQTYQAAGNNVTFADSTKPLSTYWTYIWDFGDGGNSTDMNPSHTYTGTGTYNVMLTVSNGKCSGMFSHPVIVLPIPPIADFDSIPSGCASWSITLKNTSLNTEAPGTTYRWDFGDGSYSTAKEPTYTYFTPGEYRVELTVTGPGGVSMKSQVVRAYPSPKAYFEVSPTLVFVNDERVRCFNLSEGGDYWVWDFGDGDTSRIREPYHKYMEEGVYDITLWAYSNNGCSDMFILSPGVTVQPAGDVRFSTVFTPNKTGPIERTDLPQGGTEMDQFFFPPIRDKVIKYKLQIFNRWGVLIFESDNINIPWNGYYKGNLCQQGVYVWYVEGKYANGEPFKKVGDITLLH